VPLKCSKLGPHCLKANEGALPFPLNSDPAAYDVCFRSKVQQALDEPRPPVPHAGVEAYFAKRTLTARDKAARKGK
jgi:DNA-damage-inducible protein J